MRSYLRTERRPDGQDYQLRVSFSDECAPDASNLFLTWNRRIRVRANDKRRRLDHSAMRMVPDRLRAVPCDDSEGRAH